MSELSLDRTTGTLTKAQAEVQRTSTALAAAQTKALRKHEEETKAKSAVDDLTSRLDTVRSTRAALVAQARSIDPDNIGALNRLMAERAFLDTQIDALDGAAERARSEHAKTQTDLDSARAAVARAEEAQRFAQEKCEEADRNHQEAQLVAVGDPGALARKVASDRARAVLDEHLRIIRANSSFGVGGPAEVSVEAEKIRTRLSNKEPLAPNEVGWGYGTAGAGRNTSPTGIGTSGSVDGGTSPQWNPYANEE